MNEHDTDSRDCWCAPDIYALCPECDGSNDGCWRCATEYPGMIRVPADHDGDTVTVHRRFTPKEALMADGEHKKPGTDELCGYSFGKTATGMICNKCGFYRPLTPAERIRILEEALEFAKMMLASAYCQVHSEDVAVVERALEALQGMEVTAGVAWGNGEHKGFSVRSMAPVEQPAALLTVRTP